MEAERVSHELFSQSFINTILLYPYNNSIQIRDEYHHLIAVPIRFKEVKQYVHGHRNNWYHSSP